LSVSANGISIVVEEARPAWKQFLMDELGWGLTKIAALELQNNPSTVEEFLDLYATDENGLRMHNFHANETDDLCRIC
jgi:hypothetical protein